MPARKLVPLRYRLLRQLRELPAWVRFAVLLAVWGTATGLLQVVPLAGTSRALPPVEAAHVALRLFALDPVAYPGGEGPGTWALWSLFWLAPLVTATAVVDLIQRAVLSPAGMVRAYANHVIVCGGGDHGRIICEAAADRGYPVVLLDHRELGIGDTLPIGRHQILVLPGDMTDTEALRAAGVERAAMVFLASGDPLVNMRGALEVHALLGDQEHRVRVRALVDQPDMVLDLVAPLGIEREELVDQFARAAGTLVKEEPVTSTLAEIAASGEHGRVSIVGFGRFGQAVLRRLMALPDCPPLQVEVVDRRGGVRAAAVRQGVEARGWGLAVCAHGDAEQWVTELVEGGVEEEAAGSPDLVFLCVDNDPLNLACAGRIARLRRDADIAVVLRMVTPLGTTRHGRVVMHSIPDLFNEAVRELLPPPG